MEIFLWKLWGKFWWDFVDKNLRKLEENVEKSYKNGLEKFKKNSRFCENIKKRSEKLEKLEKFKKFKKSESRVTIKYGNSEQVELKIIQNFFMRKLSKFLSFCNSE